MLVALSLAATDRLLGHIPPLRRAMFLAYAALILAALPWMHVGQREQIVLIGTLPYAALAGARRVDRSVSPFLAIGIGIGSALGFALKQYFLIVPTSSNCGCSPAQAGAGVHFARRPSPLSVSASLMRPR